MKLEDEGEQKVVRRIRSGQRADWTLRSPPPSTPRGSPPAEARCGRRPALRECWTAQARIGGVRFAKG